MDLFQFSSQGRGFLRHSFEAGLSHVTLLSCRSVLALYCLSTQRHMALKLAHCGCFSSRVNTAILVMRSASPLPTSDQKECCTVSRFKMKPLLQPVGKNGSIPAPNISLSAIPNLPRVLMVLKLLEGKTRFFFPPLFLGGGHLKWHVGEKSKYMACFVPMKMRTAQQRRELEYKL